MLLKALRLWAWPVLAVFLGLAAASPAAARNVSVLVDAKDGTVLRADGANALWYPASLTKMMTAFLVFEAAKAGKLHFADKIVVSWSFPVIPSHSLWCGGLTAPALCPNGMGFDNGASNGEADGGNAITKYVVEWDIAPTFDSGSSLPHAGETDVTAHPTQSAPYSVNINSLTTGQRYYVRVSAYNNANGAGKPCSKSADGTTGECSGSQVSAVSNEWRRKERREGRNG